MAKNIPQNSTIHFAILNSLRSWNFFELPNSVKTFSNVGGFGIEGNLSSLIGASFVNKDKLYYSVIGDLAFFYDINILGNRHVSNNIRVLLVNNGKGIEFRNFGHAATKFGQQTDDFIAAAGHFGNKSKTLVKNIVADLGFEYLCASNKEEFDSAYKNFVSPEITERPLFFEVFTDTEDESNALKMMRNLKKEISAKKVVKTLIMDKSKKAIKNIVKK